MRRIVNEEGAEAIELAIALPILILIIFSLLQISMIAFSTFSFYSSVHNGLDRLNVSEVYNAPNANQKNILLKDSIVSSSYGLNEGSISVGNTSLLSDNNVSSFQISDTETIDKEIDSIILNSDVSYRIDPMFPLPGIEDMIIDQHIEKRFYINEKTTRKNSEGNVSGSFGAIDED